MENEFLILNCSFNEKRSVDLTDLPKIMSTLNINVQNVNFNVLEASTSASSDTGSPTTVDYESSDSFTHTSTEPLSPRSSSRVRRCSFQNALHKVKRRVIAKPKKVLNYTNENDVRNYYLNSKILSKYKQSPLETIFEETATDSDNGALVNLNKSISQLIGKRKLKRSIAFTDCLNVPRSIITNRRKRIKRLLGRNMKLQKLSMDAFLNHIKTLGYGCDNCTFGNKHGEQPSHEIESDIEFVTANERPFLDNETVFSKSYEI